MRFPISRFGLAPSRSLYASTQILNCVESHVLGKVNAPRLACRREDRKHTAISSIVHDHGDGNIVCITNSGGHRALTRGVRTAVAY